MANRVCGKYFCSRQCHKSWKARLRPKHYIPCSVCKEDTLTLGTTNAKLCGKICCSKPECKTEARRRRIEKISITAKQSYATNKRRRLYDGWLKVCRISKEERALIELIRKFGWIPQFYFPTGLRGKGNPHHYWLDFGLAQHKLCVEIDGSSHNCERSAVKDARRDRILQEHGWQTLRIPAKRVQDDIDLVVQQIAAWPLSVV